MFKNIDYFELLYLNFILDYLAKYIRLYFGYILTRI